MQHIVIIGTGFSGVWSALSAKRLINARNNENNIKVTVVSPEPMLVLRPRLYEANAAGMTQDLAPLFEAAGINFLKGYVESINTEKQSLQVQTGSEICTLRYDRLVFAAGSAVVHPPSIQGLEQHAFNIDSLSSATKLEPHLNALSKFPESPARDTIVVCGGGFTGIELATELPARLGRSKRIILVEGATEVGPELGPGPRPVIQTALSKLGVEVKLGSYITSISSDGVTLKSGEFIPSNTAIWTAGLRASPLTQHIPGPTDALFRIKTDQTLRAKSSPHVFVTGDAANVFADVNGGHLALMSCQHALVLGRVSGHNAAADLLGEPLVDYTQESYGCCLDLGGYGAVVCDGWDREVKLQGWLAKKVKQHINQTLIYVPLNAKSALAAADPNAMGTEKLKKLLMWILSAVNSITSRIW